MVYYETNFKIHKIIMCYKNLKMNYKLRNNAPSGLWLSFLLPFCLFPLAFKSDLADETLCFFIITWLSVSQIAVQVLYKKRLSCFDPDPHYIFHILLSIPPSFGLSWVLSYDVIQLYIICIGAVLSYNYLVSQLLIGSHGSFTLGEVAIIAQGTILFVLYTINSLKQLSDNQVFTTKYSEAKNLLMLLLLGLLLLVCSLKQFPALRKGFKFHFTCFGFAISMMISWSFFHQQNVLLWFFDFCTEERKRVNLLLFWLVSTVTSVMFVIWKNHTEGLTASTVDRKYFHIIINSIYIPGVIYDVQFLCFASGIVLGIFIVLEIYRILNVPIIGTAIGEAFKIFLDEKDSGLLILTHIYLLIGCSCPIWLSSYVNKNEYHISLLSGITSVGFGDTFAAVGGTIYGRHTWKGKGPPSPWLFGTSCI